MTPNPRVGFAWSLLSAFLWSTTFVVVRNLMVRGTVDPLTLTCFRFAVGTAALMTVALLRNRAQLLAVTRADLARLAGLSTLGIVAMSVLLFYGQQHAGAGAASLIMSASPAFILLLGPFVGEPVTRSRLLGIAIGAIGCLMVVNILTLHGFRFALGELKGAAMVLGSALCWSLYSVFSRSVVIRVGGLPATAWGMLFGTLQVVVLRLILPAATAWPDAPADWLAMLYLGIFPTAVAFLAWYAAMESISLNLLNIMQYLTPVFTLLLARVILQETLTPLNLAGGALIIAGVACTQERTRSKRSTLST